MNTQRFSLALERLQSDQWARFEHFASKFLTTDYTSLRTVANASGDLGRDSELFSPAGDPTVLLQYSVTENWQKKIRETAKRIKENFKDAVILIYVTNQLIGAKADDLKKGIRSEHKLILDIHDRSWFADRVSGAEREKIAEELAADIVDPYLASRGIIENKTTALTEYEAKAAVLHLQLQLEDDSREKGLTKLSFDALVKSVLRETNQEKRFDMQAVRSRVQTLLPAHPHETIDVQVNSALERLLKRKAVRRDRASNDVWLAHDEVTKVQASLQQKEAKDSALNAEIGRTLGDYFDTQLDEEISSKLSFRVRRVLDTFLFHKGEEFAAAVASGNALKLRDDALERSVTNDYVAHPDDTALADDAVSAVRLALAEILQRSKPEVQAYLREIADGYTLFAFLRAVPDVQRAVQKIFRDGEIWVDTSVLLPVFAETLLAPEEQLASRLLKAAHDAGMKLFVTSGVIEELERHINRCLVYCRTPAVQWKGGIPFLCAMYALSGQSSDSFASWVENFCGHERARDDIAEYLRIEWGIEKFDLTDIVEKSDEKLRWEIERLWREAHENRRGWSGVEYDSFVVDRLAKHDVECFLGIIGKRSGTMASDLGYAHWWLTFDKTVRDFEKQLYETLGNATPKAPVMSPDFLANYLALGPVRERISKTSEATIPVAMMEVLPDFVPSELVQIADDIRKTVVGANERLIRRKLRDALDSVKNKKGKLSAGGFASIRTNIEQSLRLRGNQG